jgi:hypothetical protein
LDLIDWYLGFFVDVDVAMKNGKPNDGNDKSYNEWMRFPLSLGILRRL